MIIKNDIYGSGGELGPAKTPTDFRMAAGIESNYVALASDVNAYHNMSDKDLWAVCQELQNLLQSYGITPANTYNTNDQKQLSTLFTNKLPAGYSLTGIDSLTWTGAAPTQNGNSISFPKFNVVFNTAVLYGNTKAQQQTTTVAAINYPANSTWKNGVHFIYAKTTPGSSVATLDHQQTPILAQDGATKCMLGSVFVINGQFQAGSWKFQPWLQVTSVDHREMPTPMTKGGFVTPNANTTVKIGALDIMAEGINWDTLRNSPSIMHIDGSNTSTQFKFVYPAYNPSNGSSATIVTTKICDLGSGDLVDIPASQQTQSTGAFVIMVPCVTPAGQFLLVPPMGSLSGGKYSQVYSSQQEAVNAIYGQQYTLRPAGNNDANTSVVQRAVFLGYSIVVKVGATNFSDPEQFMAVGVVPQQLAGFVNGGGQAGGGTGAYVPMRLENFGASVTSFQAVNNAVNVVTGSAAKVQISMPQVNNSTANQFEVHYYHTAGKGGVQFNGTITWWGSAPGSLVNGNVYNFIFEYINNKWRGGFLTSAN